MIALALCTLLAAEDVVPLDTMLSAVENALKNDKPDRAKAMLDAAAKQYPNDGRVDYFYGAVYAQKEKTEDAVAAFQAAIKKSPDLVDAHLGLALQLDVLKRYDESDKIYEAAVKRFPKEIALYAEWGTTLILRKRFKEAETALGNAAKLDPNDGQVQCDLAFVEGKLSKTDAALKRFEKALKTYGVPSCAQQFGDLLAASGKLDKAELVYSKLLETEQNDPDIWYRRSKVREALGNKPGAAADKAEWEKRKKK